MNASGEKREAARHGAFPALTYQLSFFGGKYSARGLNHSDSGISFENAVEIQPGTIVYLRRDRCAPDCLAGEACTGCRSTTLATVRWCRKVKASGNELFRIGANYFRL